MYGEDKIVLYWADLEQPRQNKNIFYRHKPNEPTIPHLPLPAVLDLTHDGRWCTYNTTHLKHSKLPSPTKLAQLARRAALPARRSMFMSFLWNQPRKDVFPMYSLSPHSPQFQQSAGAGKLVR
jgi:hypothetical protein